MHIHRKIDITINDSFISKFAERYIKERSQANFDYKAINKEELFSDLGFSSDALKKIIAQQSVSVDKRREAGLLPPVLNDIYRSDLGELLMTYYFEEKLIESERYIIPLKNITFRERADMPGRGLDAIGYRKKEKKRINILFGEAKVSKEMKSPPGVVDKTEDSIYNTHKKHNNNESIIIQRLSDYCRRLDTRQASILGAAIISIKEGLDGLPEITYGCTLIRDFSCVNADSDFGKMKTNVNEFDPHQVHFSILSFKDKTIEETVDLFYKKVQELTS